MKNQSYARLHRGISMRYHWGRKVRCGEKSCIYDPTFVNQGTASPQYVHMYIFYLKYLSLEKTWRSMLYIKGIMKAKVKSLSCGSFVHGIFQARVLEWVAISWIFPTQGSNPGLLHCKQTLYRLSHQGTWVENGSRADQTKRKWKVRQH